MINYPREVEAKISPMIIIASKMKKIKVLLDQVIPMTLSKTKIKSIINSDNMQMIAKKYNLLRLSIQMMINFLTRIQARMPIYSNNQMM